MCWTTEDDLPAFHRVEAAYLCPEGFCPHINCPVSRGLTLRHGHFLSSLMSLSDCRLTPTFSLRFRAPRLLLRAFLQVCEQHSREVPLVVYSEIRSGNGSPPLSQIPGDSVLSLILPFS